MAADIDVFVRPNGDPLGGISYHRYVTHALVIVPVGAALCALPFLPWRSMAGKLPWVLLAALVAYATHPILDAFTSYGTVLGWPFTRARVAFDLISIIDPVVTGVLLVGLVAAVLSGRRALATAALAVVVLYLGLGGVQHWRAGRVQRELAASRGHAMARGRVMPMLSSLMGWSSIYEAEGRLYGDSIRLPFFGPATARAGSSAPRVGLAELRAMGYDSPEVVRAFEQFSWFADGYTAFDSRSGRLIGDMRYRAGSDGAEGGAEGFTSLWGLELPEPGQAAEPRFVHEHGRRGRAEAGEGG